MIETQVAANRAAERSSPAWIWLTAPIDVVPVIPLVENKALFVGGEECDACRRQGPALLGLQCPPLDRGAALVFDGVDGPEGWPLYLDRYAALLAGGR
jgi:hypothetical protein